MNLQKLIPFITETQWAMTFSKCCFHQYFSFFGQIIPIAEAVQEFIVFWIVIFP
jgi:flagellar biosynthesis/type III secretory pathway M-ring protein FliF/YscJ